MLVALTVFVLSAGVARGMADENAKLVSPSELVLQIGESERNALLGSGQPETFADTDPQAAEELPLEGLGRSEAEELFSSVFPAALEIPSGVLGNLEVEKYTSDYTAVVAPSQSPAEGGQPGLLISSVPLRAEAEDGVKEAADLDLEHEGGALRPQNPVVEVEMPASLDEGIALPESGVTISLANAPERSPSSLQGTTAFYPNIAADTDLSVSPTPTGFETFLDLRSTDSPLTQTLELSIPKGAELKASSEGGAVVLEGDEPQVSVLPPAAYDADGNPVPVSMQVAGDSLTLHVSPAPNAALPILVDPVVQSWNWLAGKNFEGIFVGGTDWVGATSSPLFTANSLTAHNETLMSGLHVHSSAGAVGAGGAQGEWDYFVPRYFTDLKNVGQPPTTYLKSATLSQINFWIEEGSPYHTSPTIWAGLWDSVHGGFVSGLSHNSASGPYSNATFPTFVNPNENENVKTMGIALVAEESQSWPRDLLVGGASVEVTDNDSPLFGTPGSTGWVNNEASSKIPYEVTDKGLGVYELQLSEPLAAGGSKEVKTSIGCVGNVTTPCPRTVKSSEKAVAYEPALMPTGEDFVSVTATDPVGHKSAAVNAKVKVDHTTPSIALTGTLTEQATLGTKRPSYTLTATATDGTEAAPQSGVAKEVVELDGKEVVGKKEEGCATKNCKAEVSWTLEASKYAAGSHTIKVTATDAVGITSTKELAITLNPTAPTIALAGSATEQATLGTTRPRYKLRYTASEGAGPAGSPLPGLVAAYSFDENGGTVAHDSTGNHNAKIEGASWTTGRFGSALKFNAASKNQLTIPDTEDLRLNNFTLEAWVDPEESRELAPIISKTEPGGYGYALYAGGEGAAGQPEGLITHQEWVESYVWSPEKLGLNNWSDVALTNDGHHLDLYVNGALVMERPSVSVQAGKGPLTIGGDEPFAGGGFFDGKLDELRVYNRALSASEVKTDEKTAIQSPAKRQLPIAAYNFNEETGTTASDDSIWGHNATLKSVKHATGKIGAGLEFKASEHSVATVPDSQDLHFEKFTVSGWVDPTESRTWAPLVVKAGSKGYGYALYASGEVAGHPEAFVTNGQSVTTFAYDPKAIPLNTWSYVTMTDDGQNLKLLVNGEQVASQATPEVEATNTGALTIGGTEAFGAAEYFSGKLDDLQLYNRLLSSEEINAAKNSASGVLPMKAADITGVASTEVTVDGKQVDSSGASCRSENCFITREITLNPAEFTAGKHNVVVKAADAYGNVATKSLVMSFAADTTKPAIQLSGELPTAPEGWVEQEHPYSFKAEATDAGNGVTSLSLKIDGETVASTSGSCSEGGCPLTLSKAINAAAYSGGSHAVVVTATDGAGNTATKPWTMNVDPEGHVGIAEAEATVEAMDETSSTNLVGPSEDEPEIAETTEGMSLTQEVGGLEAEGTGAPVSIGMSPDEGLTVETLSEDSLEIGCESSEEGSEEKEPTEPSPPSYTGQQEEKLENASSPCEAGGTGPMLEPVSVVPEVVSESAGSATITESEAAAINTNIRQDTDLVIRPLFDGAMDFAVIRNEEAPEEYSWTVDLEEDQELKLIDPQHAAIYWKNGPVGLGITAAPARDAIGASVPTTLSVSEGNVLTLTVAHKGGSFVYPVVGGAGWEGGFESIQLVAPPGELPTAEQEEELEEEVIDEGVEDEALQEGTFALRGIGYGAPVFDDDASHDCHHENGVPCYKRHFLQNECVWTPHVFPEGPGGEVPPGPKEREAMYIEQLEICHGRRTSDDGGYATVRWAIGVHGKFSYKWGEEVWTGHKPQCPAWGGPGVPQDAEPTEIDCAMEPWKSTRHLDALGYFRFHPGTYYPWYVPTSPVCVEIDEALPKEPLGPGHFVPNYHMSREPVHDASTQCPWGHMHQVF